MCVITTVTVVLTQQQKTSIVERHLTMVHVNSALLKTIVHQISMVMVQFQLVTFYYSYQHLARSAIRISNHKRKALLGCLFYFTKTWVVSSLDRFNDLSSIESLNLRVSYELCKCQVFISISTTPFIAWIVHVGFARGTL